jgi:two-component system chemotaxis response regulator CheB
MSATARPRIRVLVVDDSAFARKVVRESLAAEPDLEVVDHARDGLEALEKIDRLSPDVVTLDLMMPHLDGLGVLRALQAKAAGPSDRGPRVVVVSVSPQESEVGAEALSLGAVELVQKPTALATGRLYEVAEPLVQAIRAAFEAHPERLPASAPAPAQVPAPPLVSSRYELICVGTSTGGPPALTRLLQALPRELPVPVAMTLHIPPGYTHAIAERLNGISPLKVVEATDGLRLLPGMAVLAQGGTHLKIVRDAEGLLARLDPMPAGTLHRPSVDVLFQSAVEAAGGSVLGVVLTGMGDDGLLGARRIRAAGGTVLSEDRSTCVVYGMPRAVAEAGLSAAEVPLDQMAEAIVRELAAANA